VGRQISMATRNELVAALRDRYARASRHEKSVILDEFTALTGYHRKHAIRVLNAASVRVGERRTGRRVYDEAVRMALVVVWEAADRICGKRLKVALPRFIESMERHGHLDLERTVKERLLKMSAATIDRLLARSRGEASAGKRRRRSTAVGRQVPIRTFADWDDAELGHFEADFVVHSGGSMTGSMVHSLVLTEVASGWTECVPLLNRNQALVVAGLEVLQERVPMGIRGLDTDNDSAFLNEAVLGYCRTRDIKFTRSRPYRKNDQAWIEQKNGAVVRRFVGYQRFEGLHAARILTRLYDAARLYVNYFLPSFKLKEKTRIGAKVAKRYHRPATPCERLLAHEAVPDDIKNTLREVRATLDPVRLLQVIRDAQRNLLELREGASIEDAGTPPTDEFLSVVTKLWRKGQEPPRKHKRHAKPHTWRTRADPFADAWPTILSWLETEPDITAREAMDRLLSDRPDDFKHGQLRTLQRRFQEWRSECAVALIRQAQREIA